MEKLFQQLESGDCNCVIRNNNTVHTYNERGLINLHKIYTQKPDLLKASEVADKVVGRAGAALLVAGNVKMVCTNVISQSGLALLQRNHTTIIYKELVPHLLDAEHSASNYIDKLCEETESIKQMIQIIDQYLRQKKSIKL